MLTVFYKTNSAGFLHPFPMVFVFLLTSKNPKNTSFQFCRYFRLRSIPIRKDDETVILGMFCHIINHWLEPGSAPAVDHDFVPGFRERHRLAKCSA